MANEFFADFRKHIPEPFHPNRAKAAALNDPGASVFIWENDRKVPKLTMFTPHDHEHYEVILYLVGDVKYYVEGAVYPISSGDILLVKKGEMHTLLVEKDTPYERIVLQFDADSLVGESTETLLRFLDDRPFGRYNRYSTASPQQNHLFWLAQEICNRKNPADKRVYLTTLLWQLYDTSPSLQDQEDPQQDVLIHIIRHINEHLTDDLRIPAICEKFYISKSQLNRKFKQSTGFTAWEYILTKRLHLAKTLLRRGSSPAAACQQSGFRDYSSFYRLYKQRFGVSPREMLAASKR